MWITTNWKILKEMGIPDHLTCLLRNLHAGQESTVRTRLGRTDIKAIYCHPAYLTSMQSTSCEMPGWMKHKLESRLPGEISITSNMQMTPLLWQRAERHWRVSWWKWKRRVKKDGLKLNIQKMKIMTSGSITSWQIDGETVTDYFLVLQNHCRQWLQPWN